MKLFIRFFFLHLVFLFIFLFPKDLLANSVPNYLETVATTTISGGAEPYPQQYDNDGNLYFGGSFSGTVDLCPGSGELISTASASWDGFIVKISPDGTCQWSRTIGGSGYQSIEGITFDESNNMYLSMDFQDTTDLDMTSGVDNRTSNGSYDIAISKYASDGSYLWSKVFGSTGYDYPLFYGNDTIVVDNNNNVYILVSFELTVDFDPGPSIDNHTSNGGGDTAIIKLDENGNHVWVKSFGTSSWENDSTGGIVISSNNSDIYIFNSFSGTIDFDFSAGIDTKSSMGYLDIYVMKIDSDGNYGWTKTAGGPDYDYLGGITLDNDDNIYLVGNFAQTSDFDPGIGIDNHTSQGLRDAFISKYSSTGEYFWTKTIGGSNWEYLEDVIYYDNKIIASGNFAGTADFDPSEDTVYKTESSTNNQSLFLLTLNKDGSYQSVHTATGGRNSFPYSLEIFDNKLSIIGSFRNTVDFDPYGNHDYVSSGLSYGIFISKFLIPYNSTILNPTSQPGSPSINPNCLPGWKYCIQFGSSYQGLPSFIEASKDGKQAKLFIEPKAHHDDTVVTISSKPIDSLLSTDPSVPSIPFPWMQGYNIASPIWNIDIVSAFNGYSIPVLDNPAIIQLQYEPTMLGTISPKNLRIGYYDPESKRWKVLQNNTVLDETTHTISNTSKYFGYMAVIYPR